MEESLLDDHAAVETKENFNDDLILVEGGAEMDNQLLSGIGG